MKKNSIDAFASKKVNVDNVNGGYNWDPTTGSQGQKDEELTTQKGERTNPGSSTDGNVCEYKQGCSDGVYYC